MKPALRVEGLAHRFGGFQALSDVTFEVQPGTVFGFIGPNGAGKTTTIRSIVTLHRPDRGRIEVHGVDVAREPDVARRLIGYMPDHAGVYERVTGREYLEFFADVQGLPPGRVDEVVDLAGLSAVMDRDVADLSKGLKQRMQLARVLLHDPSLLVLDEPASDLDPRARIELRELILELKRRNKTILLSSHILSELADVCTHVGILERGRIVAHGSIEEIGSLGAPAEAVRAEQEGGYRTLSDPTRRGARLRVAGDTTKIAAALDAVPGISDVSLGAAGTLSLRFAGDERVLGAAVRALVLADVLVWSVEPERPDLERIFMALTRGEA